jgi:3-oxoacyl-[acyl-carrier-protein] synthase-1
MAKVFLSHNSVVSAYGFDSKSMIDKIQAQEHGLQVVKHESFNQGQTFASLVDQKDLQEHFSALKISGEYTRLEKMLILALRPVIEASGIELNERVGLILSTTKGNVDVLDAKSPFEKERAYLPVLGKVIQDQFGFKKECIVVSNACVSGILAVSVAKRMIDSGQVDHVFVIAGDLVTEFILSGFNSFQALSHEPSKPYDQERLGINIGEIAAAVLVTNKAENLAPESVEILGAGSCNDANHISGPSRTGEGLYRSIVSAIKEAKLDTDRLDYISAHGTATNYNDEMEAIAFNRLRLAEVPLNSLKGYFGHTLGASGLVESIVGMHSLHRNMLFASLGYHTSGVTQALNVIRYPRKSSLNYFLKTASGFGGVNTAVIFKKAAL